MPKSKKGDLLCVTASQFAYGEGGAIGVPCAVADSRAMKYGLNDCGSTPPSECPDGSLNKYFGGKANDLSEHS
jgi:hypothetical protein